jgi:hypothetical protein
VIPAFSIPSFLFVDMMRYQGFLPLIHTGDANQCTKCHSHIDPFGYHFLHCASNRSFVHDAIVRVLRDMLTAAGAKVLLEPTHFAGSLQGQNGVNTVTFRPDALITFLDGSGKTYMLDVTTVDVTASAFLENSRHAIGYAAKKAEARKTREYKPKITDPSIQLLPAAYELPGRWGKGLISVIRKASVLASHNGRNDDGLFPVIWKRKLVLAAHRTLFLHAHSLMRSSSLPIARFGMDVDDDEILV